jgi:hypothetical protein
VQSKKNVGLLYTCMHDGLFAPFHTIRWSRQASINRCAMEVIMANRAAEALL